MHYDFWSMEKTSLNTNTGFSLKTLCHNREVGQPTRTRSQPGSQPNTVYISYNTLQKLSPFCLSSDNSNNSSNKLFSAIQEGY